jgi:hypothetical protein
MSTTSAHGAQDAPRWEARVAHTKRGPGTPWQQRGQHPKVDGERTSPWAGAPPYVLASRARSVVGPSICPSRCPVRKYPSSAAASTWRRGRAGGGGFPPRTSVHAGTPATPPPAGPALEVLGCQEAQAVWGSPAAGAALGTARVSPGGPDSRATHNGGDAGSRRARYGAGSAGGIRRHRGA